MCCKECPKVAKTVKEMKLKRCAKKTNLKKEKPSGRFSERKKKQEGVRLTNAEGLASGNGTRTIGRKRVAVLKRPRNLNGSPFELSSPDLSQRRPAIRQKNCQRDSCNSPETSSPLPMEEIADPMAIEALPFDVLFLVLGSDVWFEIRIVCKVHHDDLQPLFHVSKQFREAVLIAREMHFDYTTPNRARVSKRRSNVLMSNENSTHHSDGVWKRPTTPKAPRHGKAHKSRIPSETLKEISAILFPLVDKDDNQFGYRRSSLRSGTTNRVLFCEDELCEAVARNKL
eukprot:Gb_00255 [translate_table: standard]